jgi:hypothetical protein
MRGEGVKTNQKHEREKHYEEGGIKALRILIVNK